MSVGRLLDLIMDHNTKEHIDIGGYIDEEREVVEEYRKYFFFKRKRIVKRVFSKWVGIKDAKFYRFSDSYGFGETYVSGYTYCIWFREENLRNMTMKDLKTFRFILHIPNYLPQDDYVVNSIYENKDGEHEIHFRQKDEDHDFWLDNDREF